MLRQNFAVEVAQTHGPDDTLEQLRGGHFDLVLVNRKLDQDYSDGLDIVRLLKSDPQLAVIPVMLVTNYAEHQAAAVAAGAEIGFGKTSLHAVETRQTLAKFLN